MDLEKLKKKYIPMTETFFYILSAMIEARHGYAVIKYVEEVTQGRIILGSGTIYGTLNKMQRDGLIVLFEDVNRKTVYIISELGKQLLSEEIRRLTLVHSYAKQVEGML